MPLFDDLKSRALEVRNERKKEANTSIRVGGLLDDTLDYIHMIGISEIRQEAVDTYNITTGGKSSLCTTYPHPEPGWTVLVRSDANNHGKPSLYKWNGTEWINLETPVYAEDVATEEQLETSAAQLKTQLAVTAQPYLVPNVDLTTTTPLTHPEPGLLRKGGTIDDSYTDFRVYTYTPAEMGDTGYLYKKWYLKVDLARLGAHVNSFRNVCVFDSSGNLVFETMVEGLQVLAINGDQILKVCLRVHNEPPVWSYNTAPIQLSLENIRDGVISMKKLSTEVQNAIYTPCKSPWADKQIWWCGTSVPAATTWKVDNPRSYPHMTGQMLQAARVFNEAVGSSSINGKFAANSYSTMTRRMGHTIAQKIQIINDCFLIDDHTKTVMPGPRSIGLTGVPEITTYASANAQRLFALHCSYEIKLVARYLLKNKEAHREFLTERLGDLYGLYAEEFLYQGDVDLFVFDHGRNEGPVPVKEDVINDTDPTTFCGCHNMLFRLIMRYKPHARIAMISDYDNHSLTHQTVEAQQQIAANWQFPFLDLRKHLPFHLRFKVRTSGYWDAQGNWFDSGFTWSEDEVAGTFSTNAFLNSYVLGDGSLWTVKAQIQPRFENGVWTYEMEPRYIWIKDGLHPHSNASDECLRMYAQAVTAFFMQSGNGQGSL